MRVKAPAASRGLDLGPFPPFPRLPLLDNWNLKIKNAGVVRL